MNTVTLPGTLDSLKPIRDRVLAAAEDAGLENKAAYRLALAVDEIASNVIIHAYEDARRAGSVDLHIDMDAQELWVVIEDDGEPFDPRENEDPDTLEDALHERPIGGLGIYLALNGVDRFDYEYINGRNRNIFAMKRVGV